MLQEFNDFLLFFIYWLISCLCRTALMLAALGRHTDCVHILLEKGAKADAADKNGFTALHRAVSVCVKLIVLKTRILDLNSKHIYFLLWAVFWLTLCRSCWPVKVVYLRYWNMELLLFIETLREERRCTFQHLWATQSCCDCSSKLLRKQTLWTPCWTTAATPRPTGPLTTVRKRIILDVLQTVMYNNNDCFLQISYFILFF